MDREKLIEEQRALWAKVAKEHGWYTEPFHVIVWFNDDGTVQDSLSHKGLEADYLLESK